jgi:purine-nucleoside phosphorylase
MSEFHNMKQIERAADSIQKKIRTQPRVALVLGSGLGTLAEEVQKAASIPYQEIPEWPKTTVVGHEGQLVIGELDNISVVVMQGRAHYYEGYSIAEVTFPIRVFQQLGIEMLFVTNAAGAINPAFLPGDVMMITDHITLMAMAGQNPLRGPNLSNFGERFPDMSQSYDLELMGYARNAAKNAKIKLREGVYICLAGPSFETPADLRFLRTIGADAVGMSTVPEVIVARHGGMRVLGLSGVSNKANLDGKSITTHEEVLKSGEVIVPKLKTILSGVLGSL